MEEPWTEGWAVAACVRAAKPPSGALGEGGFAACQGPEGADGAWDGLLAAPYRVVGIGGGDWRVVWLHQLRERLNKPTEKQ